MLVNYEAMVLRNSERNFHTATENYTAQNQNQTLGFKRTLQDQDNGNNMVNDVFQC